MKLFKEVKRQNIPLHLLVVLSRMALVDTILPYLPRQETGDRMSQSGRGVNGVEPKHTSRRTPDTQATQNLQA